MKRIKSFLFTAAILMLFAPDIHSSSGDAWNSLTNLQVVKAKKQFTESRIKQPEDLSLMRGLYLAAALDLDHELQVSMVDTMLHYHPGDPYLLAIFEHVAAELGGWSDQTEMKKQLGESIAGNSVGALAHSGRQMQKYYPYDPETILPKWEGAANSAPGFWICGPFENTSNIAVNRPLVIETEPLDTLAKIQAKHGYAAQWTWLDTSPIGNAYLSQTTESGDGDALVLRVFFELPSEMDVMVLPGGAYSGRILIDGHTVLESLRFRNAVQREGTRVTLTSGIHSLTAVVCETMDYSLFSLIILNPEYKPIDGFQWLRNGHSFASALTNITDIHPIFDPREEHVNTIGYIHRLSSGYEAAYYHESVQRRSHTTRGGWDIRLVVSHKNRH